MESEEHQAIENFKPKSFIRLDKNVLTLEYEDKTLGFIRINLNLDETFRKTGEILVHESLLRGAYFMVKSGLPAIVFFGGSLIRNQLDIEETKIDDYDMGYFDKNRERGEAIVLETLKKLEESAEWKVIERTSDKICLPLAREEATYFLESGASAFLTPTSGPFAGSIFEFGHEDKLESTLSTENVSADLVLKSTEKNSSGMVFTINCGLRGRDWAKTLNELVTKQAIINRNGTDFVTKFDILQRILVATIKYGVPLTGSENPESAMFILNHFDKNSFYLPSTGEYKKSSTREDLIILEKRKEFCLNKFFNLLTRISPLKREVYLHDLVASKILAPFIPEVNEMLADKEVRGQLLRKRDIKGALQLYQFVCKTHSETKSRQIL